MMTIEEKQKILEQTIKDLLDIMGFRATVFTAIDATNLPEQQEEASISVEIQVEDSSFLIGKHGVNLAALQHLSRVMVKKRTDERINFSVDVNGYKKEYKQSIVKMAREMANRALADKKAVVLRPMSAYERRLVHIELAQIEGVKTESMGEGEDRKVVIKPAGLL